MEASDSVNGPESVRPSESVQSNSLLNSSPLHSTAGNCSPYSTSPDRKVYVTRSGRTSRAPLRFEHKSEVLDDYNSDEHDEEDDDDTTDVTSIETSDEEDDDDGSDLESFIVEDDEDEGENEEEVEDEQ